MNMLRYLRHQHRFIFSYLAGGDVSRWAKACAYARFMTASLMDWLHGYP